MPTGMGALCVFGRAMAAVKIVKVSDEGRVYGWASVIKTADGTDVVDLQGDVIEPAELEKALTNYMLHHRASGVMHEGEPVGTVIEAAMISPERLQAMGFEDEMAKRSPTGVWVGMQLDPASQTFAEVKSGKLAMFSIQGRAVRQEC